MGVMSREMKKLRGRSSYMKAQEQIDALSEAQVHRKIEDMNHAYLKQLYYGLETLIDKVTSQEILIQELAEKLSTKAPSMKIEIKNPTNETETVTQETMDINENTEEQELERALKLINDSIDIKGRIAWRKLENPKELIFAYIRKAESEGLNIDSTMDMQRIPEYRRAFQYVVYNLGSWKEIVEEYRNESKKRTHLTL